MQQSYYPPGDYSSGSIKYTWFCSRCDERYSEARAFSNGDTIWIPNPLPGGWHKVDGEVLCPAHRIEVTDAT